MSAAAAQGACTQIEINAGFCVSAGIGDGQATLEGSGSVPGSGGGGTGGGASSGGSDAGADGSAPVDPYAKCIYILNDRCMMAGPSRSRPEEPAPPVQPITLADIAQFRPDPGVNLMEPAGWMIVGLDTNFFSTGGVQIKDGTLLGQPASVRFTPVRWNWTYGDGTSATSSTPGSTWAAQGIAEFDPTPTSHIYGSPGTYYIDLTIGFTAEYRFAGSPWIPINGVITLPANRLVATAGYAKTVLVDRDCTRPPSGPGC